MNRRSRRKKRRSAESGQARNVRVEFLQLSQHLCGNGAKFIADLRAQRCAPPKFKRQ
ncbi:MAG: hypothetical protein N6V49_09940 [Serratia symbiotica]|nr:hypothetical protein [Serratia symbiotica]